MLTFSQVTSSIAEAYHRRRAQEEGMARCTKSDPSSACSTVKMFGISQRGSRTRSPKGSFQRGLLPIDQLGGPSAAAAFTAGAVLTTCLATTGANLGVRRPAVERIRRLHGDEHVNHLPGRQIAHHLGAEFNTIGRVDFQADVLQGRIGGVFDHAGKSQFECQSRPLRTASYISLRARDAPDSSPPSPLPSPAPSPPGPCSPPLSVPLSPFSPLQPATTTATVRKRKRNNHVDPLFHMDNLHFMIFLIGIVSGSAGIRSELGGVGTTVAAPGSLQARSCKAVP